MEQKFFDAILDELRPLLSANGFTEEDGVFNGENYSFKVVYSEERASFLLMCAEKSENGFGEYAEKGAFLFDGERTEKHAVPVGIDFADTVSSLLGVNTRRTRTVSAELPQKTYGEVSTESDLAQRMLALFPRHKDTYLAEVGEHGEFLRVTFFLDTVCEDIRELLEAGDRKKLKKVADALDELYLKGDRTVCDTIIVVILAGSVKDNTELKDKLAEALADYPHLKNGFCAVCDRIGHDKRLKEMFGLSK